MPVLTVRTTHIASIDHAVRQITWESQKQSLHTLSRADINLTTPQMITLFAIRAAGTCRMSELADVTQQSAGTLTGIVDRLIEDGLVGRVRDAGDRRVVQVALTDMGEERLDLVEQARLEDMAQTLDHFSDEQICQFEDLLCLFLQGLHELRYHEHASSSSISKSVTISGAIS